MYYAPGARRTLQAVATCCRAVPRADVQGLRRQGQDLPSAPSPQSGTKRYELHKYAQATLGAGNLHDAVTLPEGEDLNEWLAVNVVDFFNEM